MSLSVSASARIPVCRTQSQNVYLKLSLSINRWRTSLVNPFLSLVACVYVCILPLYLGYYHFSVITSVFVSSPRYAVCALEFFILQI